MAKVLDRDPVENEAYAGFLGRTIKAMGRRVAAGDVEDIGRMLAIRDLLDDTITEAVRSLNAAGESWGRIGAGAGITRQAAQQRWGAGR